MKKYVFETLGQHEYFEKLNIPKRRFFKELTASQIVSNFYSLKNRNEFTRARFLDLQDFLKRHLSLTANDEKLNKLLLERLDIVSEHISIQNANNLKNRAIGITIFFFINKMIEENKEKNIRHFIKFVMEFLKRLKTQVAKGIDIELRYRDLLKFQTYISQAAVEKYAIENRQTFLQEYFDYYQKNNGKIKGNK